MEIKQTWIPVADIDQHNIDYVLAVTLVNQKGFYHTVGEAFFLNDILEFSNFDIQEKVKSEELIPDRFIQIDYVGDLNGNR